MTVTTTRASVADPQGKLLKGGILEGQIVILFDSNRIYNMILSLIFPMFRMQFPPVTPKILRSKLRCYPQQHIHALVHRTWHTLFPKHQAPGTRHSISDPTYLFQNLAPRLGSRNLVHKPDSSSPVRATLVVPGNWIALENPSSWTSSPLQCLPSFCRYAYYMYRTSTEDPTMRFSDVFNNVVIESWPSQVQSSFSLSWPQAHLFSVLLALLRFASLTFASYFEKDTASCSPTLFFVLFSLPLLQNGIVQSKTRTASQCFAASQTFWRHGTIPSLLQGCFCYRGLMFAFMQSSWTCF